MSLSNDNVGLVDPFGLSDEDGYTWLKGNLHSHSTNSDGRVSPQERLDGYVGQGYDFLCLSDHDNITPVQSVSAPDPFVLVEGVELHPSNPFGGQVHHFLALDVHEDISARSMPPQHVIDAVLEQGGSIWLAHPHWSSVNIMRDTLPLRGLAGVEVFNSTCRSAARGESSIHWDDWMEQENRIYPCLANDDSHDHPDADRDTYHSWTMVRVKERTPEALAEAMVNGSSYGSTGPEIHDIRLEKVDEDDRGNAIVDATVRCSEAQRIAAVMNRVGREYRQDETFEEATIRMRPGALWVRFEIIGPDGSKAWSNPFDLTVF